MKRIAIILAALMTTLTLCSCGGQNNDASSNDSGISSVSNNTASTEESAQSSVAEETSIQESTASQASDKKEASKNEASSKTSEQKKTSEEDKEKKKQLDEAKQAEIKKLKEYLKDEGLDEAKKKEADSVIELYTKEINKASTREQAEKYSKQAIEELDKLTGKKTEEKPEPVKAPTLEEAKSAAIDAIYEAVEGKIYRTEQLREANELVEAYKNEIENATTPEQAESLGNLGARELSNIKTSEELRNEENGTGTSTESSDDDNKQEESGNETKPEPKPPVNENGSPVSSDWFNDALFIGDSVTLKLSYYADNGSLGDADFLCAGSLGYNNALWGLYHPDNVHPTYNGVKYTVDEGCAAIKPKKIFIMLGMNDIGLYGVDGAYSGMQQLIGRIVEKCPDSELYIESVTPMLYGSQLRDLNNTTIAQFDDKLRSYCSANGYHYMDIASAVEDSNGNLIDSYCSDASAMGLHFSDAGCYQWVEYLKNHV